MWSGRSDPFLGHGVLAFKRDNQMGYPDVAYMLMPGVNLGQSAP